MNMPIEQSIKSKLKSISTKLGITFNQVLDQFFLERVLVRVSKSKFRNELIFKGGLCLSNYIKLTRMTQDIDFLATKPQQSVNIQEIFTEIMQQDLGDGIKLASISVSELSLEHKKYPGYAVKMKLTLGNIRTGLSVDIGCGDVVRPNSMVVELMKTKSSLFEESVSLNSYPPEYIFSEKLEAILFLGSRNSRLKDYFDCYQMLVQDCLDKDKLKNAIAETFENRNTKLSKVTNVPDVKMWRSFLKSNDLAEVDFNKVIDEINKVVIEFMK